MIGVSEAKDGPRQLEVPAHCLNKYVTHAA